MGQQDLHENPNWNAMFKIFKKWYLHIAWVSWDTLFPPNRHNHLSILEDLNCFYEIHSILARNKIYNYSFVV